jgi:hypothetical protein
MKSKKLLKFLLPITLGIWGYIGYKIYLAKYGEDDSAFATTNYQKSEFKITIDTFTIKANYRDPFSVEIVKNNSEHNHHNVSAINNNLKVESTIIKTLPNVQYLGLIKNSKSNKQIALLSINGSIGNYSVGDNFSGVEVLKIFKDSVQLKFNKDKFFVKK